MYVFSPPPPLSLKHTLFILPPHTYTYTQTGAHVYVCGDAVHMAGDVHEALLGVMETAGGLTRETALQYMHTLETNARYQRDVWVT